MIIPAELFDGGNFVGDRLLDPHGGEGLAGRIAAGEQLLFELRIGRAGGQIGNLLVGNGTGCGVVFDLDGKRRQRRRRLGGVALQDAGQLDLPTLIRVLTIAPAQVFGLEAGTLRVGAAADLVIVDPGAEWTVDVRKFQSKGRNSPLHGERMRGLIRTTMVGGEVVHEVPQ